MRELALKNGQNATSPSSPAGTLAQKRQQKSHHHVPITDNDEKNASITLDDGIDTEKTCSILDIPAPKSPACPRPVLKAGAFHSDLSHTEPQGLGPKTPALHSLNSPNYQEKSLEDSISAHDLDLENARHPHFAISSKDEEANLEKADPSNNRPSSSMPTATSISTRPSAIRYTSHLRTRPPKTFRETLKPWNGRLRSDNWLKAAIRPFILFAYPAVLWSTLVYSFSINWLIILSETISTIFRDKDTYNFSAFGVGLIYISPFIGGVIGTAVAGKASDFVVRAMSRKNGGIYEPEFRLVMAVPVAISTGIGLMAFGWSAQEQDAWIVPTLFLGLLSFGCSLGSTTAITFAVDSYRQYAGEALVTLNFSKSKLFARSNDYLGLTPHRHARTGILPILSRLARKGWFEERLRHGWWPPNGLRTYCCTHVYIWEAHAYVDFEKEFDGEILTRPRLSVWNIISKFVADTTVGEVLLCP